MADMEDDKDVSRRYRELPRDEPPPALDAKIRTEARSALETHAAPLVAPTGRRRWYFPVAAAAIIVLAVAVTTQVEREQPAETVATAPEAKNEALLKEKQKVEEAKPQRPAETRAFQGSKDQSTADSSTGVRSREDFNRDNRTRQERPMASPPAASAEAESQRRLQADLRPREKGAEPVPEATAAAKLRKAEPSSQPAPGERASSPAPSLDAYGPGVSSGALAFPPLSPEASLERIAELRRAGRHEEADKALAEFRKRYPDYKIPPAMLEKVEKR